ncbi:MAG: L,D-transpeptidase family protein [Rhodobacteraceae bacterium]|nr:L,D-transpeptidase family protein [Paracoccaceae bacterium]
MIPRFDDLIVTSWGARFQGRRFPCAIGRSGIGVKLGEGDGITPVGCFTLAQILIRPDRLWLETPNLPQSRIGPRDIWSDDPSDPDYNHQARAPNYPFNHEALRRPDPLYNAVGILDYNWPEATPDKGSAIFLHVWRKPRHPTEGCIAFAQSDLIEILTRWTSHSLVIIRG